jgi:lantibiotic leader peptide-processing serine protease
VLRSHHRALLAFFVIGASSALACSDVPTTSEVGSTPALQHAPGTTGEYVILAAGDVLPADLETLIASAGGTLLRRYDELGVAVAEAIDDDFAIRAAVIDGVASVTEDRLVQLTDPDMRTVDLPYLSDEATGEVVQVADDLLYPLQWAPGAVNAPEAWNAGFTGRGVRVAILDGGLFNVHPDLAPNLDVARSRSFVPGFPYNSDAGTFWHGTHVAGIVAAADNNGGIIGIAPHATLIGVKTLHNGVGAFDWFIQGVMYAATPVDEGGGGAHIINMSLGLLIKDVKDKESRQEIRELTRSLDRAMRYAHSRGVTIIAAAGNDTANLDALKDAIVVPAQSAYVISIGATGPVGWAKGSRDFTRLAPYSNWGKSVVDLSGPGGARAYTPVSELCTVNRVTTNCWVFDMVFSTTRTGWAWAEGTSMASPIAAGIAALVIERAQTEGVTLSPELVEAALRGGAQDLGKPGNDVVYGKGWINAFASIRRSWPVEEAEPSLKPGGVDRR